MLRKLAWLGSGVLGAGAMAVIALANGETVNAALAAPGATAAEVGAPLAPA